MDVAGDRASAGERGEMAMSDAAKEFGQLLRKHRKKEKRTLSNVARSVGLSVSMISDIEHGRRRPPGDAETVSAIARAVAGPKEVFLAAAARSRSEGIRIETEDAERQGFAAALARDLPTMSSSRFRLLRKAYVETKCVGGRDPGYERGCEILHARALEAAYAIVQGAPIDFVIWHGARVYDYQGCRAWPRSVAELVDTLRADAAFERSKLVDVEATREAMARARELTEGVER